MKSNAVWRFTKAELPKRAEDLYVLEKGSKNFIGSGKSGSSKNTVERIAMNFDP